MQENKSNQSFHNTGIDWTKEEKDVSSTDWVFGGVYADELIEIFDPEDYLPKGESQALGQDKMDCVTRAYINKMESFQTYEYRNQRMSPGNRKWVEDAGFIVWEKGMPYFRISNKFTAIKSGTTRNGNSLIKPADSIYRDGVVSKVMLTEDKPETWEEYHNKKQITQEMIDIGKEYTRRFPTNYEKIPQSKWKELPLGCACAVYAWPNPINGVYPRTEGRFGHCVYEFKPTKYYKSKNWKIYDNYENWRVNGGWIKELAPDYNFYPYGYRLIFRESPMYEAPADGETYNKEFKKGAWLTFLQMWHAVFKNVRAVGGAIIDKLKF